MSTVYDVAVVGSGGFLGSAIAAQLDGSGVSVGRFTKERPFTGGAATIVWAAGHITPVDTAGGGAALANLRGLVEIAGRDSNPPHVVLISSGGAVYGPPAAAPFSESDAPSPANEYGRIKLAEETLLAAAGIPHTVLRVANPYGPAQVVRGGSQGVIGAWMRAVLAGEPVAIFGDGSVVRDYVYIDDVAAAVAAAVENEPGGVVNIGSGVGTSLARLSEVLSRAVAPRAFGVRSEPARGIDPPANWLDVSRARDRLGWSATTSLEEGIARTWAEVSR